MHILKTEHLCKKYKGKTVVHDVSFAVKNSEIIGLLGPNGSGKTTSFYMTLGIVPSNAGKVLLDTRDITKLTIHERAKLGIGYLPQEPSIFRKLNVRENILAILELRQDLTPTKRQMLLQKLLQELRIEHLSNNMGYSLSGGERRRVEIARALALEPKFMLLDEPFAGIDPISIVDLKQIIRQLNEQQVGVLITDHNVRDILDICHRAYIVSAGKVIATGTPQEILQHPKVRSVYLGEDFYFH